MVKNAGQSASPPSRRSPSHWLRQAGLGIADGDPLPARAEVVVIGGGVSGVSTTYWLARLGVEVLLLEAASLAAGASGRNGGLFLGSSASLEKLEAVLREEAISADYEETGHLSLASSPAVLEQMRQEVAARPPDAMPVEVIGRKHCEALLAMPINKTYLAGRWTPRAATLHPVRLVCGMAAAALRRGARVVQRTSALRLRPIPRGEDVWVETNRGRLRAGQVVLACNAAGHRLWPQLGKVITPVRGQMLSSRPMPRIFRLALAVDWGTVYWRQTAEGVIVLGGFRNLDPVAETGRRAAVNPYIQSALARFLPEAFPGFPAVAVRKRWAGIMDQTPDGRPIVGRRPDWPNLWAIGGFGGHGLPPAIVLGEALAKSVVENRPLAKLDAFNPARFKEALAH